MRRLLIPAFACCALLALAAFPAFAAEPLDRCAAIDDPNARLACFDRLSRERAGEAGPPQDQQAEPRGQEADPASGSGREHVRRPSMEAERVEARIESVHKTSIGRHVMTLSNGQVWMENEPGKRPIAAGQRVVIRQYRLHYEMELPSQPDVAVRRVE